MVRMLALVGVVAASIGCQQDCTPRGSRVVHQHPTTSYVAPVEDGAVEPVNPPADAVEPMPAYPEPPTLEQPPLPSDVPAPAKDDNPFE